MLADDKAPTPFAVAGRASELSRSRQVDFVGSDEADF